MVRAIAVRMLQKLGFAVVEATNGREGLERYGERGGDFRFVVTDLGMPIMDGYQMFRELKRLDAALPIVITTGFGDADVASRLDLEEIAEFIGKPYNFAQFRDAVRRVVDPAP